MPLTFKDVAEILKMIDASQCEEVVIELQGVRLVVRRGSPHGATRDAGQSLPRDAQASAPANLATTDTPPSRGAKRFDRARAQLTAAEGRIGVHAPMVGTFYRRPSPPENPFVEVGHRVKTGDPLCLVETMKLYTTVHSPADGEIEAITVEDASPVEFDQLLVVIKPVEGA